MIKYFIAAKVVVGSLLVILFLSLLCVALYNQLSINLADIRATAPMQSSHCPDFNKAISKPCSSTGSNSPSSSSDSSNHNEAELQKLRTEICAYRIAYNRYNEQLNRRERQITNSENYQTNIVTVISVIIGLVALALGSGTWIFSSTIANNEIKVKNAQQTLKKAQEKFVSFQKIQQMQSDCEIELLKSLRDDGFDDHIVASLMIELRIYLPLLASGDGARVKRAAQALASYVTDNNLSAMTEYARHCQSKTPEELHYLFNFALPENEQI